MIDYIFQSCSCFCFWWPIQISQAVQSYFLAVNLLDIREGRFPSCTDGDVQWRRVYDGILSERKKLHVGGKDGSLMVFDASQTYNEHVKMKGKKYNLSGQDGKQYVGPSTPLQMKMVI